MRFDRQSLRRVGHQSTITPRVDGTTASPPQQCPAVLSVLDRLTHRCQILETKGKSYRLQDAKRRRKPN